MTLLSELNSRSSRLGFLGVKLASVSAFFAGLVVAKLFPDVLSPSVWWYVLLAVACALHPVLVLFGSGRQATPEAGP